MDDYMIKELQRMAREAKEQMDAMGPALKGLTFEMPKLDSIQDRIREQIEEATAMASAFEDRTALALSRHTQVFEDFAVAKAERTRILQDFAALASEFPRGVTASQLDPFYKLIDSTAFEALAGTHKALDLVRSMRTDFEKLVGSSFLRDVEALQETARKQSEQLFASAKAFDMTALDATLTQFETLQSQIADRFLSTDTYEGAHYEPAPPPRVIEPTFDFPRRFVPPSPAAEFFAEQREAMFYMLIIDGDRCLTEQAFENALGLFQRAERFNDDSPESFIGQGIALNMLGRHAESVAAFEEAQRRDPSWPTARPAILRFFEAALEGRRAAAPSSDEDAKNEPPKAS